MIGGDVLDFDGAMDRVDGDRELYFELIDMFFEDADRNLESLQQAVKNQDCKQVESLAHSMKSALGNLGAMSSFQAAFALEKAGRAGDVSNATADYQIFKGEIEKFKQAVAAERG